MPKISFKNALKYLYFPRANHVEDIVVPPLNYLMIDGAGGPASSAFRQAIAALYPMAYALKLMIKKGPLAIDYGVMPLEGLWWAHDMSSFISGNKDQWLWTLMIMQPDLITAALVDEAVVMVKKKKSPSALSQIRFARYDEGTVPRRCIRGRFQKRGQP